MSAQWCDRHWKRFRIAVLAGTHSGGQAAYFLMGEAMQRVAESEMRAGRRFPRPHEPRKVQRLMDRHNPLCCFVGDAVMDDIYRRSHRSEALEVRIYARSGGYYQVQACEYERLRTAWLCGTSTLDVTTIHGHRLIVSLEDVAAIGEYPRAQEKE